MKKLIISLLIVLSFFVAVPAQIPTNVLVQIVKAEDERRYDQTLENLLKNPNPKVRERAALAVGRIGDERGIDALAGQLKSDESDDVRVMIVFALGEIESAKGAAAVLEILKNRKYNNSLRARALEAAGKIAAANPKDAQSAELGKMIVSEMQFESSRRSMPNEEAITLGLTAILRSRPDGGEQAAANFLDYSNPRIRADALNTLARLKSKSVSVKARELLTKDENPVVRANAARVLGAAEDQESLEILLNSALNDADLRVRVSAVRAVGNLKNAKSAAKLIERGGKLLTDAKNRKIANPPEKNELLEIAASLGRILPNTDDKAAVGFLDELHRADRFVSPETEIALARIAPKIYLNSLVAEEETIFHDDWRASSAAYQGLAELAQLESNEANNPTKSRTRLLLAQLLGEWLSLPAARRATDPERLAVPDLIQAFAAFKSDNTSGILRPMLEIEPNISIRAAIAGVLAEQPADKDNIDVLKKSFTKALLFDKTSNDAQLAILDALYKVDKNESVGTLLTALGADDYLVRKKAFELLRTGDLEKDFPGVPAMLGVAESRNKNRVLPPFTDTKLGVILNTNADYTRAVSRKNGGVKAILTTEKGVLTIQLAPEDAPLTVDNFIKLARAGYFDNLQIHRVVPNFVVQDGDPQGDGNGGPGWQIRCEINLLPFERGAVGMALSGKDTGGSQWFVTHSPQPHLDGGYTVFGKIGETDMKVVDNLVRGDKILSVKIVESKSVMPTLDYKRKTKAK